MGCSQHHWYYCAPVPAHTKASLSLHGLILRLFYALIEQLLFQESCTGCFVSHSNPSFASNGDRRQDIFKQILTQVWLSLFAAWEFQQMKILRCTTKKAGPFLTTGAPAQARRGSCIVPAGPFLQAVTCMLVVLKRLSSSTLQCDKA